MTWTPADGPSREELARALAWSLPEGIAVSGYPPDFRPYRAAQAAHDLYEENQRLKAQVAAAESEEKDALSDLQEMVAVVHQLRAELAEAKRDTERYRWLRDLVDATLDPETGESYVRFDPLVNLNAWAAGKDEAAVDLVIDVVMGDTPSEQAQ